jgi:uncharacterized protein HemX
LENPENQTSVATQEKPAAENVTAPDRGPDNNVDRDKHEAKDGVSSKLIIWSVSAVLMLGIGWISLWQMKRHEINQSLVSATSGVTGVKGIIAIDSARIFNLRLTNFMANDAASSDKQATLKAAGDFGQRFHDIVQAYQQQGYVVINSHAILAGPADMDKTAEVAAKLGIRFDDSGAADKSPDKAPGNAK